MATQVLSEEATCYKVIARNGKTFFYYVCNLTGKKIRLHHNSTGFAKEYYVGRTTKLVSEL